MTENSNENQPSIMVPLDDLDKVEDIDKVDELQTIKVTFTSQTGNSLEQTYLIEEDGVVYGGSAGAIIFGKDLDSCKMDDKNEVGLIDINGFNMINDYSLLCHYTNEDEDKRNYLLELSKIKKVYAIPEEDTIYINDNKIEFIGTEPYYEFINGEIISNEIKL